jgi:hypothetical protein
LSYPAFDTTDQTTAKLTHRVHLDDTPGLVPAASWSYNAAGTAINLTGGFIPNDIYEFSYKAKDPTIAGLGFAAVRDWVSWLRYGTTDDVGTLNPLANYIDRVYTEISSQPGRMFNDFRKLGFNEDDSGSNGRKVFDGHMQWIAAGSGIGMNYRFSQSGRTERNRQDHLYAENVFPFREHLDDRSVHAHHQQPICELCDDQYVRVRRGDLLGQRVLGQNGVAAAHSTGRQRGSSDSPYTRNYFMSSMRHGTGNSANRGLCQQFDNPLNSAPVQRALFLALDAWTFGTRALESSAELSDGTLVLPANTGFRPIFQIRSARRSTATSRTRGSRAALSIRLWDGLLRHRERGLRHPGCRHFPPVITPPLEPLLADQAVPFVSANGPIYPSFVPKTDSDGNDIAGVRLPDVTVPLATYTGWALRRGAQANDGCEAAGQYIPFAKTTANRVASGDPRPSVERALSELRSVPERGAARDRWDWSKDRLLLCEDADDQLARLIQAGLDAGVPQPRGQSVVQSVTPLCLNEKRQ